MTWVRKHSAFVAIAAIVLAVAAVRLRVAGVPLERDEGEYAYAGQLILQGIPPYALAYNMKFPGTYYAYSLLLALFGQTPWGIHVGLLFVNAATTIMVWLLGRKLLGEFGAVIAAAAFAVLSLDRWTQGVFAHATHFVLLPALAGLWLLLRATETKRTLEILIAGMLLGTAVLMKQHAAAFVLLGMWIARPSAFAKATADRRSAKRGGWSTGSGQASFAITRMTLLIVGAAIPIALVCVVLAAHGVMGKFWFWTVLYAREYVSENPASDMLPRFWRGLDEVTQATLPIWLFAAMGVVTVFLVPIAGNARRFLIALTVASLLAMSPGFYFRPHYFILALPAAALLVGVAVVSIQHALERTLSKGGSAAVALSAFLAVVGTYVVIEHEYLWSMSPATLSRRVYPENPFIEAEGIGRYIRERTAPDDRIAVLGSEPEIYFYAGRKSATGYIYTYALMERQRYAARMQSEMIEEIESMQPAYLVLARATRTQLARGPEEVILQWSDRYILRCYDRVGVAEVGRSENPVIRFDAEARDYQPAAKDTVFTYRRKSAGSCSAAP